MHKTVGNKGIQQRSSEWPRIAALIGSLVLSPVVAAGQDDITVPPFHDTYSTLVAQLESGQTDIDYRQFRESFLESRQFEIAARRREELGALRAAIPQLIKRSDYPALIETAKKILSIDYTDIGAHKVLQVTYKILKDEEKWRIYHDVEFGLLKSIVRSGDGKSCKTAWPVVQLREEYVILEMLGATLRTQSLVTTEGPCDRMEVSTDRGDAVYYFGVAKVIEKEARGTGR